MIDRGTLPQQHPVFCGALKVKMFSMHEGFGGLTRAHQKTEVDRDCKSRAICFNLCHSSKEHHAYRYYEEMGRALGKM